ncbi:class I glutamine amidotransferase-like protein, partial [Gorgonomyces haynaldii]
MIVAALFFDGWEILDILGPFSILMKASPETVFLTVAQDKTPKRSTVHFPLIAQHDFEDCPKLDVLLLPGGAGTLREVSNPKILAFLKKQAESCRFVCSICTGSSLLGQAGLLDGKRATTNKAAFDWMQRFGKTEYVWDARFVHDGNIITASGVSAGMDMGAYLAKILFGDKIDQVMKTMLYNPLESSVDPFSKLLKKDKGILNNVFGRIAHGTSSIWLPIALDGPSKGNRSCILNIVLDDGFDTLDCSGMLESFVRLGHYQMRLLSLSEIVCKGGDALSNQHPISVQCDEIIEDGWMHPACAKSITIIPSLSKPLKKRHESFLKTILDRSTPEHVVLVCGQHLFDKLEQMHIKLGPLNTQGYRSNLAVYHALTGTPSIAAALSILNQLEGEKMVKGTAMAMEIAQFLLPPHIQLQ